MTDILHNYILPFISIASTTYIIFILFTKRFYYKNIQEDFFNQIEKNKKLSHDVIREHFENMQQYTKQALKELDADAREQLQEAFRKFEDINKAQQALSSQLAELQRANAELQNEIKKRDAIIERKTKQVQRLKKCSLI